jgi:dsRNA-specific ribonuclease
MTDEDNKSECEFELNSMVISSEATDIKSETEQNNESFFKAPPLLIKECDFEKQINFPNVYHIFQCLTTKSAHEQFDFERYEIMGDCFLKLTVVMKIYLQFTNTNEGNMAELKSHRVSNKYLYKLARNKNLNEFINSENFKPKINWILPVH